MPDGLPDRMPGEEAPIEQPSVEAALAAFEAQMRADPSDLLTASDYRQLAIEAGVLDRAISFASSLAEQHSEVAEIQLTSGLAKIDKVPTVGPFGALSLASGAVDDFSRAIELQPSALAYTCRGVIYLYWPPMFGRIPLGIADLERAVASPAASPTDDPAPAIAWMALGDGHGLLGKPVPMRRAWTQGLEHHPQHPFLLERLALEDEEVAVFLRSLYDPKRRFDTDLRQLSPATTDLPDSP